MELIDKIKNLKILFSKITKGMTKDEINHALDRELIELLSYEHLKVKIINETLDCMIKSREDAIKILGLFDKDLMAHVVLNDKNAQKAFFMTLKKVALPYILKKWVKNGGI